ncbi:alpha/beta fold hydrolase [Duganella sp. FT135W]|uniref:Alpha/beta fold hydrolase n=1 Tax=Duganella flavida TaxID=2692175 RepID=A0A6L8KFW5_9BURK|nr:alpha/beta hydrolase [Duganella flavida]MYM25995.1 alpha/beta fold hydrolase [Duganella flavida]
MQLVFIHGALNDHRVWAAQSRYFTERGHKVMALDLPGHASAAPALTSVSAMADWLLAQLDAAGVTQAALIGHSMGSLIALEAAARAPQRVSHLVMLGSTYPMKVADALLDTARDDEAKAINMVTKWSHTPGYAHPEPLRQLMQSLSGAQLLHTDLAACNSYDGGDAAAALVRCPTLFIFGSADVMTPAKSAAALVAAIPQAQTITLASGHALMTEQADAVNEAVLAFIGSQ